MLCSAFLKTSTHKYRRFEEMRSCIGSTFCFSTLSPNRHSASSAVTGTSSSSQDSPRAASRGIWTALLTPTARLSTPVDNLSCGSRRAINNSARLLVTQAAIHSFLFLKEQLCSTISDRHFDDLIPKVMITREKERRYHTSDIRFQDR